MRHRLRSTTESFKWSAVFAAVLVLVGCGSSTPDPTTVSMTIAATGSINPNSSSEPSPVVLRIYQLKSDSAFKAAEFSEIFYSDRKVLGGDLLGQKEFNVKPGGKLTYDDTVSPETRYIGIVAGFRDIDNATWRVIEAATPENQNAFTVSVDSLSVSLQRPSSSWWKIF
ncbi:type VI secretion system lipoprotein TssJ [Thalassobaculum sp.]|uniref:type VI secretion system lipoprotein TssJ n=1 Tax=Thalassobaculum sp. TaxID=2022740 RepID=UPI0032EC311E